MNWCFSSDQNWVVATQIFFSFTPDPWGHDEKIWRAYFSNGLVQPPTRKIDCKKISGKFPWKGLHPGKWNGWNRGTQSHWGLVQMILYGALLGPKNQKHKQSGQIITTFPAEVTLNGGLIRELPQNPLNSGLGIILICPETISVVETIRVSDLSNRFFNVMP